MKVTVTILGLLCSALLHAQGYPNKPIKTGVAPAMFGEAAKSLGYHPFPIPVATSSAA